jgi:hypothetical protein
MIHTIPKSRYYDTYTLEGYEYIFLNDIFENKMRYFNFFDAIKSDHYLSYARKMYFDIINFPYSIKRK